MTSRCSEDRKGRAKINCCVTATPFPLGLSTVPPGSSAGLGSGWVARSLGPNVLGFFCVFFSLVRAFGSPGKKIFLGPFVCFFFFFPPSILLLLRYSQIKVLGYAFWSSAILYVEAFQGDVGESSQR